MVAAHIGLKIRERRKEIGLSQTELAGRIGISVSYLNLIEHNKRSIGGRLLRQVADEIGVGLEMLDGATERRLARDLTAVSADPLFARMRPDPPAIDGLAGRSSALPPAAVPPHDAFLDRSQATQPIDERLNNTPTHTTD